MVSLSELIFKLNDIVEWRHIQ